MRVVVEMSAVANMYEISEQLYHAWDRLSQRWSTTAGFWHDVVRHRFQKEQLAPLEQHIRATQREMERLAQVIEQARRHVK